MRKGWWWLAALAVGLAPAAGCHREKPVATVEIPAASGDDDQTYEEPTSHFRDDGSLLVPALGGQRMEVSAPLVPCGVGLRGYSGRRFPHRVKDKTPIARQTSLPYALLLELCAPHYPIISVPGGEPLTPIQRHRNVLAVELCAVERLHARWWWLEALLERVDVCEAVLGPPWHTPSLAEVNALTAKQHEFIREALDLRRLGLMANPRVYAFSPGPPLFRGQPWNLGVLEIANLAYHVERPSRPRFTHKLHPEKTSGVLRCFGRTPARRRAPPTRRIAQSARACARSMIRSAGHSPAQKPSYMGHEEVQVDLVRAFKLFAAIQQLDPAALDVKQALKRGRRVARLSLASHRSWSEHINRVAMVDASQRLLAVIDKAREGRDEIASHKDLGRLDELLMKIATGELPRQTTRDPAPPLPRVPYGRRPPERRPVVPVPVPIAPRRRRAPAPVPRPAP